VRLSAAAPFRYVAGGGSCPTVTFDPADTGGDQTELALSCCPRRSRAVACATPSSWARDLPAPTLTPAPSSVSPIVAEVVHLCSPPPGGLCLISTKLPNLAVGLPVPPPGPQAGIGRSHRPSANHSGRAATEIEHLNASRVGPFLQQAAWPQSGTGSDLQSTRWVCVQPTRTPKADSHR